MKHKVELFYLFGAWLSFVGVLIGGIALFPVDTAKLASMHSPAAIYRAVKNEELRNATILPIVGKVITIDQTGKKISLYEDGASTKSFVITKLPEPFSDKDIPTGSYAISIKESEHLSRKSGLWLPYTIGFSNNFFIHGTPTKNNVDGTTDLSSDISEHGIELDSLDAKEVFDFAKEGMKIIITGGSTIAFTASSTHYYLVGEGHLPPVSAHSFFVADIDTGEVLWDRNSHKKNNPEKLSSLVTAFSAINNLDQYKNVRMGELVLEHTVKHRSLPSREDEVPLGSLIYPLLFNGNETAEEALQSELGSQKFTNYMNAEALALGMNDTEFSDRSATTTAYDLFQLLSHINKEEHFLIDVSLSKEHALYASSGKERYHWENKNPFVLSANPSYQGGFGVRESYGESSGMFMFSLPLTEFGEQHIAIIILGSENIEGDIDTITTFVGEHYRLGNQKEVPVLKNNRDISLSGQIREFINTHVLNKGDIIYDRDL